MTFIAQVIGIGSSVLPYGELTLSRFYDPAIREKGRYYFCHRVKQFNAY